MIRISRRIIIAGATTLVLAAGSSIASAAVMSSASPVDSSGVIHGCWTNSAIKGSHVFVLQDVGSSCPNGTTAISWDEQGPAGATGPSGPAGPTGPAGPSGSAGPSGPAGATGPAGPAGPAGPTGPAGVVGEVYEQNSVSFPVGLTPPGIESVSVTCPQGYVATGGGFGLSGPQGIGGNATEKWIPVFDDATTPNGVPSGWEVGLAETGTAGNVPGNYVLNAYVYCAPTS
jgi:Collagen triple helix repeat (20 copies)